MHTASRKRRRNAHAVRIGLAIAGGGPLGGMYELGALRALEEAITPIDMTSLAVYVGVSSGALIAAGLANGLDSAEMCRIFISGDSSEARFRPETFVRPAFFEYLRRVAGVPGMLLDWVGDLAKRPFASHFSDTLLRFGSVLPTGLFDNGAIEEFLHDAFSRNGRSDDFRKLARKLYVIAAELDTGKAVRFGDEGFDAVPISRAIAASAALPGMYPPVLIDGKFYVDGALQRTLHASVALDAGADLVFGINPLVPFDSERARSNGRDTPASLIHGGLPAVLSQTFRTLLRSRMHSSLARYAHEYRHADVVLFEPDPDDAEMFFTNVFSFASRRRVAEHAYQATRADLRARAGALGAVLARHGLELREDVLADRRTLLEGLRARRVATAARLHEALDTLHRRLPRSAAKRHARDTVLGTNATKIEPRRTRRTRS
ncbi:MAG TPA: patatin-like phospholipase family protein [Rudaea sp.]|nr:patatin-like phospholipase family protein [Rudaea sp.]